MSPPMPARRPFLCSPARCSPARCAWVCLALLGCERAAEPHPVRSAAPLETQAGGMGEASLARQPAADPAAAAPAAVYSPFAVRIDGGFWIGTITFKDVGLRLSEDAARSLVHETLAEAVAERLSARHAARLDFDPLVADPRWHSMCAGRHLYVDVWQASHPPRFGYSLWSGCGADDRLAWAEFPLPAPLTASNVLGAAIELAERVVGHIDPCPSTVCG